MAEVAVARASRQDQVVVLERETLAVHRVDEYASPIAVDAGDFSENHRGVVLPPHDLANRRGDLPRSQNGRRDLIEKRLEQVMVLPVDDNHLGTAVAERLGGR